MDKVKCIEGYRTSQAAFGSAKGARSEQRRGAQVRGSNSFPGLISQLPDLGPYRDTRWPAKYWVRDDVKGPISAPRFPVNDRTGGDCKLE